VGGEAAVSCPHHWRRTQKEQNITGGNNHIGHPGIPIQKMGVNGETNPNKKNPKTNVKKAREWGKILVG